MATSTAPDPRRWLALVVAATAQLMVALDATIVNIALPSAQTALQGSDAQRQWVITAYTLAFGGLLLLGGRVADRLGRKRTFLVGLAGFAVASALGGAAPNLGVLIGARALQGCFAALLTPTALSLVAVTFTDPRERAKAFAVYGGIAGSGGALGLILGGALTQWLSWRWCLYVNVPIAIAAAIGAWTVVPDARGARVGRFDITGAVLATGGLIALVEACTRAVSDGWGAAPVIALLGAAAVLFALFVLRESTAAQPLLPLRIVRDRNRGGAYVAVACAVAAMYGVFLLLTYDFQVVLQYSPIRAGLAFLPMSIVVLFSSGAIASRLLPRVPPRRLIVPGLLVAAAGMLLLTGLRVDSSYVAGILPAEVLLGLGMGCVFVPAFNLATQGVDPREAGIASATANTAQQVGGSVGTALLNTVAASAATGAAATHAAELVHGYSVATGWGAAILLVGALLAATLVNAGTPVAHGGRPARSARTVATPRPE
ncbi:MAG TPA: MFS transporter [Candidatus Dormibacteraeota bacterium]|nr:MFS transporter [Candidatus Dormibacteraeota bacterium]